MDDMTSGQRIAGSQMTPQEEIEFIRRKIKGYEDEDRERRISLRIMVLKEFGMREEFEFQDVENMVDYIINGLPTPQQD